MPKLLIAACLIAVGFITWYLGIGFYRTRTVVSVYGEGVEYYTTVYHNGRLIYSHWLRNTRIEDKDSIRQEVKRITKEGIELYKKSQLP